MTTDSHRWNADIDPTVMIDDDGTPWIAWGNGDCYISRLKPNMIELDGYIRHIGVRNYSEGPWLFKRNGIYYNVYAALFPPSLRGDGTVTHYSVYVTTDWQNNTCSSL